MNEAEILAWLDGREIPEDTLRRVFPRLHMVLQFGPEALRQARDGKTPPKVRKCLMDLLWAVEQALR